MTTAAEGIMLSKAKSAAIVLLKIKSDMVKRK